MSVPLLRAWEDWACPNCGREQRVSPPRPPNATVMHTCPRLHGLQAPMVRAGADCKVVAFEREDYLNGDTGQPVRDGRVWTAVNTVRADGSNDAVVFAPVARARG